MYIYDWIDEHNVAKETQRHFVAPMNKDNGWKGKIQLTVAFAWFRYCIYSTWGCCPL